jgi:hypothetical protein
LIERKIGFGTIDRVALVRNDVSDLRMASIIGVIRIGDLGTTLAVISNRSTGKKYVVSYKSHPA